MVMKKNVMRKNLTQSILRSFGRYLAIVLIIALGSAMFVGLLMSRTDMVKTGQVFTDEQNMFDLRLVSTYGWTEDQVDQLEQLPGLTGVEASRYQDAIVRLGDSPDDQVYRFYSIPARINRVELRGGRMPQASDECLADGFYFDDSILGTRVTLADTNEAAAFDALAHDTYTVVGYVATPLYMDLNRGTTTVGNGSIESYFYIPAEGFSAEYYTEVNVTIPGEHTVYSEAYNGAMDAKAAELEPRVQAVADRWFQGILDEAEAEYADGYQKYLDGLAELEQGKLDAEQELSDAFSQLQDAEREIAENELLLADGEQQIASGKKELQKAEQELSDGRKTLEQEKKKAYAQLDDAEAELDANAAQVADGLKQVEDGLAQLEVGLAQVEEGIAQLEEALPQIEEGIGELEPILEILTPLIRAAQEILEGLLTFPDAGEEAAALLEETLALLPSVTEQAKARLEALIASGTLSPENAEKAEELLARLPELEEAARQALEELKENPEQLGELTAEIENALAELEATLSQYTAQLQELKEMLAQYSAQLEELLATCTQLQAQREELLNTKKTLQEAQKAIEDGYKELEKGREEAEAEFTKAQRELKDGQRQIDSGWTTLSQKEKELKAGRTALEEGRADLAEGWAEYEAGKLEAERTIADAEAELADAEAELAKARQEIDDLEAPETYVLDRNTNVGYASLEGNAEIVAGVSRVLPVFFLLIAALVCITTMSRMVSEERTQIGTLKALGYSRGAIMSKYLIYAGTGGILGCGLGVLAGSTVIPQIIWDAYCIMLHIEPDVVVTFDWGLCAAVVLTYTAVVLAVTWYCCGSTLREVPAELIRPKAPTSGKKIFLEYLPFWERLSFLNKVALRNIFRYRQRLLMMLIGIGGCTALLVSGFGLRDSISNIAGFQYEEISQYDLEAYFDGGQSQQQQAEFRAAVDGEVFFYHMESVELDFGNRVRGITLLGADPEIADFIRMRRDGGTVPQPGAGEVLLTVGVCEAMGVDVGDEVVLRNADMRELRLTVSGIYENYVQNYAVVSPETVAAQWGSAPELQMAFVRLADGADLHETGTHIAKLDGVMNVMICQDNADTVGQMMGALDMVVWMVVVCAGLLAVTVLYNLINININERIREIATIKVLGFHSGETASYVFKENMVLSVLGAVLGLGLGKLLLDFIMQQVKIDMVWFQARVSVSSLLISVGLTWLATAIVQFIFTFKIRRINMAEALKSVE